MPLTSVWLLHDSGPHLLLSNKIYAPGRAVQGTKGGAAWDDCSMESGTWEPRRRGGWRRSGFLGSAGASPLSPVLCRAAVGLACISLPMHTLAQRRPLAMCLEQMQGERKKKRQAKRSPQERTRGRVGMEPAAKPLTLAWCSLLCPAGRPRLAREGGGPRGGCRSRST